MFKKVLALSSIAILIFSLVTVSKVFAETAADCKAEVEKASAMLLAEGDAAIAKIKEMRFGDGNYCWIHDMQGMMVMHPIKPELDGKNILGNTDPNGKALFAAMNELVGGKGAGWVTYMWPKPGAKDPSPKVSYVKLVKVGGKEYVVGSGIYDVTADQIKKDFSGDAIDAE